MPAPRSASESTPRHPIRVVARRAGLTPEVIRAWESRYGAVRPARSATGRRLFADADVERLVLLKRATGGGRSIGLVAHLTTSALATLVAEDGSAAAAPAPVAAPGGPVAGALAAVRALEGDRVEALVRSAAVSMSVPQLIDSVLVPLMQAVGEEWHAGRMGVAQEHLASAIVRGVLAGLPRPVGLPAEAPLVVIATPAGQRHELGAMAAAATAHAQSWRVFYLGADVPAPDIAAVAQSTGARLVALSITYADGDSALADEFMALRRAAPGVRLVAGGRAAARYRRVLQRIGADILDIPQLRTSLAALRTEAA